MAGRSPVFRNSDAERRALERRLTSAPDPVDLERFVGDLFRAGNLFMPTFESPPSSARAPDMLGRSDGLILSIELGQSATGPWRSSEDRDLEIQEHGSPAEAMAARRREEEASGVPFGAGGWVDTAVYVTAELAPGLPLSYYRHRSSNDAAWNRLVREERLRSAQATVQLAIKWLVRAAGWIAEEVAPRQQAYDRFTQRVGADPRLDSLAAWHALMDYYVKTGKPVGAGAWRSALEWLELVTPPPVGAIQSPTGAGHGYAWAAAAHLSSVLGALPGVIVTPYNTRDYGPFSLESNYHAFASARFDLSTRRARRSRHTMPVEVRYPTLMGLGGEHENEMAPTAGRWYVGLGSGQPSTIQDLYRPTIDAIRRDFPGAEVFVRDMGRYPTDYEGRRLEPGRYH